MGTYNALEDIDSQVRNAAFEFLKQQTELHGDVLPKKILQGGFGFMGRRVPLMGPQGIFRPAILDAMPISITSVPVVEGQERPYDDEVGPDGLLRYKYRGSNPQHPDNVGLRLAMQRNVPLVYHHGVVPGQYRPVWPVYVMHDDPASLTFSVAVDDVQLPLTALGGELAGTEARRQYITTMVRQRLHQRDFRYKVIAAYRSQCAICRLRHEELLDAAHILPDGHPHGSPIVPNGLALCKLHHAAFDQNIVGIRPDLKVEIREDVLKEEDGPMLQHGLQEFNSAPVWVPRKDILRPKREFLEERYKMFKDYRPQSADL
ncbi:MAG: HNH endonuclease [Elusimicrobia bacterium]|nr:HNH endonuclease [Elusimicrobiota bacterium]